MTYAITFAAEGRLQFRFQPGDGFSLMSVTEQKTTRIVDGNEQAVEQTVRLGCNLNVEEVDGNGCAWARYTYRRAAMKTKSQGIFFDFDTDANQLLPRRVTPITPFALAVGEEFYVRITPQGLINKINGLQVVVSAAKGKVPPSQAGRDQFIQVIDSQLSEPLIKGMLEDQLAVFPDACSPGGIEVGDTWSRSNRIEEQGIVVEQTWRLKSRNPADVSRTALVGSPDSVAVIDVNLVVSPIAGAQEILMGGVKARREVSGRGTGQLEIEESTGRIIKSSLTQDLVEETKVSSQGLLLRPPPAPEPARTHIVATFQMIKRGGSSAGRGDSPASSLESNQP
jgi:hypothetical protein